MGSKKLDYQNRAFDDSDLQELPLQDVAYPYEEVNFSQNRLSAEGLRKVLDLCSRCEKLRILKLYKNDINDDAAQALSRFIRKCYSLEELHLSHNRFTARGVEMLVEAAQEARYAVDGGAPMWMRLEQNDVQQPDQVLDDLQHRYSVCSKRNRTKCSNRVCMHNCKVHLPHFHFQRDEFGQPDNDGPRKRKWEAHQAQHEMAESWQESDWRAERDDWFDGRPEATKKRWEEPWQPEERPAGPKMPGGLFMRAMGGIVQNKDDDDGREGDSSKRRRVPNNVASRTLSQLGVLAEPRKSKVLLKEAPKGIKDEDDGDQELEEEDEGQASDEKDEDDEEDEELEGSEREEQERGRPSRAMAERRGERSERAQRERDRRGRRREEQSRRHREGRREAHRRERRSQRRRAAEPEHKRHRSRSRRGQRERSRERRRAVQDDRAKERHPERGSRRADARERERRGNREASPERPRRRDERAAAGERTEKLLEKIQGSREKVREPKAVTKQEPSEKAPPPFVATRAKAAPRRPASGTQATQRPKGTSARVPAVAPAPKVAAKAAVADGNESEYTYTEASEYTYEDVEGEEEEEAVEVEDDSEDE